MIHVTEKAAEQIKALMKKEGLEDHLLRIAAVGGGCSGMSYKLAFDKEAGGEDTPLSSLQGLDESTKDRFYRGNFEEMMCGQVTATA